MKKKVSLEELDSLEALAQMMDAQFKIPFTGIRFGIDSLIGIIPGVGDAVGLLISGYLLKKSFDFQLPLLVKIKILFNILIDFAVGLVPIIGDIFDVVFKVNKKNVELIYDHVKKDTDGRHQEQRKKRGG